MVAKIYDIKSGAKKVEAMKREKEKKDNLGGYKSDLQRDFPLFEA